MQVISRILSIICCSSSVVLVAEGKGKVTGGGTEVGGGEAVGDGGKGGGEGGGPSRLRLPKDGRGGLPRDMTRRRPEVGDGEGRKRKGRR